MERAGGRGEPVGVETRWAWRAGRREKSVGVVGVRGAALMNDPADGSVCASELVKGRRVGGSKTSTVCGPTMVDGD